MNSRLKTGLKAGCLTLSLVTLIILGGLAFFMKDMGRAYKQVEATEDRLLAAFGPVTAYVPPGNGIPTADRLDAFLTVRESGGEWRLRVENTFRDFMVAQENESGGGVGHFIRLLRATSGLSPVLAGFWTARNEALLAAEMGPGEYVWIYCLGYYAWLGFDPADGARESWAVMADLDGPTQVEAAVARQQQREATGQRVAAIMLPIMRQVSLPEVDAQDTPALFWSTELAQEVARMESDPSHMPWVGGLPPLAADAFAPHEARFREQFSLAVNPIELMFGPIFAGASN